MTAAALRAAAGRRRATRPRCTPPAAARAASSRSRASSWPQALGARPSEVVFTGSGTESDNLAVKGIWWARRAADPRRTPHPRQRRRAPRRARRRRVARRPRGRHRRLARGRRAPAACTPTSLREAIERDPSDVALVTVMWANNEVGTVQPVRALADVAHEHGIPFHSDAVQAVGQLPVDFAASGVDALTITGHKFGGPLGAGALLLGRDVTCTPLLHGGGQERDVRSGTLDTPVGRRPRRRRRRRGRAPARAGRAARRPARRPRRPGARRRARRGAQRRPRRRRPAARQRALLLPRLRGRLAAAAARRPRRRGVHRLGLLGRRRAARATCCSRMGAVRGRGPQLAALLARPHLDRRRRRRAARRAARRRRPGARRARLGPPCAR